LSGSSSDRNARASSGDVTTAIGAIITGDDPYAASTKSALEACMCAWSLLPP
jgi:hypothetical protein